jgi:putative membrane protein
MKNLINFRSVLIYTMCIAGTLVITTSCSENRTNDSRDVAEKENNANLTSDNRLADNRTAVVIDNDNDAQFLMDAAEMQHEEIRLGQLAQQKGNSAHVKDLGKMMEDDHSKGLTELQALAQSKSVSIPSSATEDSMDAYKDLNEKTGNDFDKSYSDLMVEHHEDAIKLYEDAASDSEDANIRTWASEKLPGLRTHLKHAEASRDKSDDMK